MSSEEEHAAMHSMEHEGYILKGPKAKTFSATHPAYTYTSLCPDPELREPPKRKKVEENGKVKI